MKSIEGSRLESSMKRAKAVEAAQGQKSIKLTFNDSKYAFQSKSTFELLRAGLCFKLFSHWFLKGDIDVDDGCWRRYVSVTTMRCFRFRLLATDLIHGKSHQHNEKSRQHNGSVTNI